MMFIVASFWLTLVLVGGIGVVGGFLALLLEVRGVRDAAAYIMVVFVGMVVFLWASDYAADALIVVLRATQAH